jgi:predicted permease
VADAGAFRGVLIVASVALATVMLVGAALVGGSFVRLMRVDLGYSPEHVLTGSVVLPQDRYTPERTIAFEAELERRVGAIPGVRAVGVTNIAPFSGGNTAMGWAVPGREPANAAEFPVASWRIVSAGYFTAMGIPLKRGRVFDATDVRGGARVMVINEALARRAFPGADPVGRSLTLGNKRTLPIVGVVGDTRLLSVDSAPAPTMYFAHQQTGFASMWVTARTTGDPEAIAAAVRREVAALDGALPVARLQPLGRLVANAMAQPRLTALIFGIFASAALTLAAVGLYGLVSYTVSQRTRELGVRLALGAAPRRVVRGVLAHGVRLAALGVALGAAAAYAGAGFLRSILYETSPTDAVTFAGVVALLFAVAALASVAPARRAARLDPVLTLKSE